MSLYACESNTIPLLQLNICNGMALYHATETVKTNGTKSACAVKHFHNRTMRTREKQTSLLSQVKVG